MFFLWTMFAAGLLHGLGPDHLTAIAALAGRDRQQQWEQAPGGRAVPSTARQSAVRLGVRFALGHVVTLLLLAGAAGWLGQELPVAWQQRLEQLGGVVLVFLGGWLLATVFRRRVTVHTHAHTHEHSHQRHTHEHPHIHLGHTHGAHRHPHPAWIVGGLLGFSGARALLTAVPLVVAGSLAVVVTRALAFGVGMVISMAAAGWVAARIAGLAQTPACARLLVAFTGGLSTVMGLYWLTAFAGG